MDPTHLHLILNHFPILGTLFGLILLGAGLVGKNESLSKAGLVTFIFVALITIPVFLTGEPAEETVENLPGVSENYIEIHEEAAESALWIMEFLGLLSLVTLIMIIKGKTYSRLFTNGVLILSLIVFIIMARVGNFGGEIRHSEIRKQSQQGDVRQNDNDDNEHSGE